MVEYRASGVVDVQFGQGVIVQRPVNLYGCTIGDECFVGPFVEIQRDVVIGARCRIQSHSFICGKVTIGDDCFIGHGVTFTNDLLIDGQPAYGRPDLWRPTRIGNRVAIGSGVTLLPVSVCDGAVIGAGAVVTRDIVEPGTYKGNPARR